MIDLLNGGDCALSAPERLAAETALAQAILAEAHAGHDERLKERTPYNLSSSSELADRGPDLDYLQYAKYGDAHEETEGAPKVGHEEGAVVAPLLVHLLQEAHSQSAIKVRRAFFSFIVQISIFFYPCELV